MCAAANEVNDKIKYNHDECDHTFLVYKDSEHVKEGEEGRGILGSPAEFCGAFYHTPKVPYSTTLNMVCLDPNACQIGSGRKNDLDQPKTAVALVKYEIDGINVFLKRYTNCYEKQAHAEDYFKYDIMEGPLKQSGQISKKASGEITMYITMQPCHRSTLETKGTSPTYSCCDILNELLEKLPQDIKLCIKPTHLCKAGWDKQRQKPTQERQEIENAEDGLKGLMRNPRITFAAMTKDDWEYLWKQVNVHADYQHKVERKALDEEISKDMAKLRPKETEKQETEKQETEKQAADENEIVDEMNKMKL
jgi:hypothetical protein